MFSFIFGSRTQLLFHGCFFRLSGFKLVLSMWVFPRRSIRWYFTSNSRNIRANQTVSFDSDRSLWWRRRSFTFWMRSSRVFASASGGCELLNEIDFLILRKMRNPDDVSPSYKRTKERDLPRGFCGSSTLRKSEVCPFFVFRLDCIGLLIIVTVFGSI